MSSGLQKKQKKEVLPRDFGPERVNECTLCSRLRTAAQLRGFTPTAGHSSDRNRPLGPADTERSSSGPAHIQLFFSLTSKGEKRGMER